MKEITPPEGYTVDPTEYEVDLAYEGQEVAEVTRDLTVQEQVKKAGVPADQDQRRWRPDRNRPCGRSRFSGVSGQQPFQSREWGNYSHPMGISLLRKISRGYDFSKEEVAVTYVDGKVVPVPELITDKKGICPQSGTCVWSFMW